MTYLCNGTETPGANYYFVYSKTNYQFVMPNVLVKDMLVFDTTTTALYFGSTIIPTSTGDSGTLITFSQTPNPSYKQPINVLTGDVTVNIIGKNLLSLGTQLDGFVNASTLKFNVYTSSTNAIGYLFETSKLDDIPVICYGLKTDFRSELFPGSKRLLELADSIEELITICECGKRARFNARIVDGEYVLHGKQIAIDNIDAKYKSLCGKCYLEKVLKIKTDK